MFSVWRGIGPVVATPIPELFADAKFEAAFASMLPLPLPFWMTEADIKGGLLLELLFPMAFVVVAVWLLLCKFLSCESLRLKMVGWRMPPLPAVGLRWYAKLRCELSALYLLSEVV